MLLTKENWTDSKTNKSKTSKKIFFEKKVWKIKNIMLPISKWCHFWIYYDKMQKVMKIIKFMPSGIPASYSLSMFGILDLSNPRPRQVHRVA